MVISKLFATRKPARCGPKVVPVAELDRLLDVETASFPKAIHRLARDFRKQDVRVDVGGYRDLKAIASSTGEPEVPDVRGSFYHTELRRIPPMEREEEFRMARRYEFLRLLVQLELERLGYSTVEATELAGRPASQVFASAKPRSRDGWLDRVVGQLEELRNLYVEGALHIVLATVNRYRGLGVDSADLIQEGNASLFQAIEGFDWRRDVRFRTYAQYWVHQAVLKMLYNSARTVRIPIWVQKVLGKIRRVQEEGRRNGREFSHEEIAERLGITTEKVAWVLGTKRYAVSIDAEIGGSDDGVSLAQMLPDETLVPVPDSVPEGDLRESLDAAMADLPDRERMILSRRFGLDGKEPATLGEIAVGLGITAERVRQLQNAALTRMKKPAKLQRLKAFVEQV